MKSQKSKMQVTLKQSAPMKNWERYKGSIVMTIDDEVYVTKNPKRVLKMIQTIEKKHHKKPLITVVPKGDTLIVLVF